LGAGFGGGFGGDGARLGGGLGGASCGAAPCFAPFDPLLREVFVGGTAGGGVFSIATMRRAATRASLVRS
jgi:hypothetical protein